MKSRKLIQSLHALPATARMIISLVVATLIFLWARNMAGSVKWIAIWLGFALSNLFLLWLIIRTARPAEIQRIAKKEDTSRVIIFLLVVIASFVSLIAVIILLHALPEKNGLVYYTQVGLTVTAVISSWALIHTLFTFHYAHFFYSNNPAAAGDNTTNHGGLEFPGEPAPDYMDFAYFSFVVGMTFQVSDVQITSRAFRRLALLHGLLSFAFNTVIVALSINIIFGIIQR
jgi:uncharacterized membrane protein